MERQRAGGDARPAVTVVVDGRAGDASAAVASVAAQTLGAVEPVVVGSAEDADPAGRARGEYVMFLSAGQTLDRHACLTLYAEAERSGARIVCGDHAGAHALYRRDVLDGEERWPVGDEDARRLQEGHEVVVLPHRVLRVPVERTADPRLAGAYRKVRRLGRVLAGPKTKKAVYRRVLTRLPVRKGSAFFESDRGRSCTGCPRALYERLLADGYRIRAVWSGTDGAEGFPPGARVVRRGSWAYYRALARAEFWIDDRGLPTHLTKRPGTVYLQTWHTSAHDLAGFDLPDTKLAPRADQRRLRRSAQRFDHFVVASEHDRLTLMAGLRTCAEPLPVGRPRNDVLFGDADSERLRRVADRLGLDPAGTTVLYAPGRPNAGLNLEKLAIELGEGYTVLGLDGDVDDLPALLRLTDVLVTDRAPVVLDYVLLDRPIVFVEPEGPPVRAYLDLFEHDLGPIVADQDGLLAAVRAADENAERHREARRRFAASYAEHERGGAAAAIAERLFAAYRPEPRR